MSYSEKRQQVDLLQEKINAHGALSDEVKKKINYKFRLDWNYYSNSMEGNTLTMEETRSVMVGNLTVDGKPIKDVLEMRGHNEVVADILKIGKGELRVSEKRIRDIHIGIMHEEDKTQKHKIGIWKTDSNYVINYKGEKFEFVAPVDVPERMHDLLNKTNSSIDAIHQNKKPARPSGGDAPHPLDVTLQFHLDYVLIHPFYDGNGRTARILSNLLLISFGYPPFWVKTNERNIYNQYIADIQGYGGNPNLFFESVADMILRSQQLMLDAIEGKEISEAEDWEKQLALLKKQGKAEDELTVTKSVTSVLDILNNCAFPLLEKVMLKLAAFDELFTEKRILFGSGSYQTVIMNLNDARENLLNDNDRYMNDIRFTYSLNGYKKSGTNTFSVSIDLSWNFEQFKYRFFLNHSDHTAAVLKLYHQYFDEIEINAFVNESGSILMKQIESQINRK